MNVKVIVLAAGALMTHGTFAEQNSNVFQYMAKACVTSSGNDLVDLVSAEAIAKGRIAQAIGGQVSAHSQMVTTTKETVNQIETQDVLTETVSVTSQHYLDHVEVITKGIENHNAVENYCVTLGIRG